MPSDMNPSNVSMHIFIKKTKKTTKYEYFDNSPSNTAPTAIEEYNNTSTVTIKLEFAKALIKVPQISATAILSFFFLANTLKISANINKKDGAVENKSKVPVA